MNAKGIIFVVVTTIYFPSNAQSILKNIIHKNSLDIKYKEVFEHPEKYRLQVIYTRVLHDKNNKVILKKYLLEPPTRNYYYPASLVKLPVAALALEKINKLKIRNLTKDTRLCIDSSHKCEMREYIDTTSITQYPTIAQYIKRMLLVSDNNAFARAYEFVTPEYINKRLHEMGYVNTTINQRLKYGCDSTDNCFTNGFTFFDKSSNVIYNQPATCNTDNIRNNATCTVVGKGYQDGDKQLPPRNFRNNNYIPFEDENNILISLIYPHALKLSKRFDLTPEDYTFLKEYRECFLVKVLTLRIT